MSPTSNAHAAADKVVISVANDFSRTPGPRHEKEGPNSGEAFLNEVLEPRFKQAKERDVVLEVSLDGVAGYATSFLEAAFGGLARIFGIAEVESRLTVISEDEPYLKDEVSRYIKEALDDE